MVEPTHLKHMLVKMGSIHKEFHHFSNGGNDFREYTLTCFFGGWKKITNISNIFLPNGGFFMVMFIPWDRNKTKITWKTRTQVHGVMSPSLQLGFWGPLWSLFPGCLATPPENPPWLDLLIVVQPSWAFRSPFSQRSTSTRWSPESIVKKWEWHA